MSTICRLLLYLSCKRVNTAQGVAWDGGTAGHLSKVDFCPSWIEAFCETVEQKQAKRSCS